MIRFIRIIMILAMLSISFNIAPSDTTIDLTNYIEYLKRYKYLNLVKSEFDRFIHDLGYYESSNNWTAYNKQGYIGTWQFGYAARKETGYCHVTFSKFKNDPNIFPVDHQLDAVIRLLYINHKRLTREINKYNNTIFNNNFITTSGILAAAHLAGANGVKLYFRSNGRINPKDINNTYLSMYLNTFSGYEFDITLIKHLNNIENE